MKVYKKVIIDGMNSKGISHDNNDCAKQQEQIRYLFDLAASLQYIHSTKCKTAKKKDGQLK